MKVLAIDVGKGTQDILLYDSTQRTENCIKMVLPSQTQIIAQRIMQATAKGSNIDVFLKGFTDFAKQAAKALDGRFVFGEGTPATGEPQQDYASAIIDFFGEIDKKFHFFPI